MKTRSECYNFIKVNNLSDEVKTKFGRHYTNVSTDNLIKFVESKEAKTPCKSKSTVKSKEMHNTIESKFAKLVEILGKHRMLLPSEIDSICKS